MIPYINFASLVVSSILFSLFYVKSVRPAALAKSIGPVAYERCGRYRMISGIFMLLTSVNYILYYWFPLPLSAVLPRTFPWPWSVSAGIAVLIDVPSLYLMIRGAKAAGEETMQVPLR